MSHAHSRMSEPEFLAWQSAQGRLFELVDGAPLGMVGARHAHDRLVMNAIREVGTQLRGKPCQPFGESLAVRIPAGNLRRPDLGVDCGVFDGDAMVAAEPRLVVEVLSPSTRALDQVIKLDEYRSVASLDYILLIDPGIADGVLWTRAEDRLWLSRRFERLDDVVDLPLLGLSLRLADLYEGLILRPAIRAVPDEA